MSRKSDAQKYLERDKHLKTEIECLLAERQQWKDIAMSITSAMGGERVQSSGAKSKLELSVSECDEAEAEILAAVKKLASERKAIRQALRGVENPTEYKVLHMRYIQHKEVDEVAEAFGSDYTWVTTCQGRGFKSLEAVLANL